MKKNLETGIAWLRNGLEDVAMHPMRSLVLSVACGLPILIFTPMWMFSGFFVSMFVFMIARSLRRTDGLVPLVSWKKMAVLSAWSWAFGLVGYLVLFYFLRFMLPANLSSAMADASGVTFKGFLLLMAFFIPGILSLSFFLLSESFLSKGSKSVYKSMSHAWRAITMKPLPVMFSWFSVMFVSMMWFGFCLLLMKAIDPYVSKRMFGLVFLSLTDVLLGGTWVWGLKVLERATLEMSRQK